MESYFTTPQKPIKGDKGEQGERGFTGEEGKPGKDGKDGINGKDAPDLQPKELIEKINRAKTAKISRNRVDGLDELEGRVKGQDVKMQNFVSLGGSRRTNIQANGVAVGQADTLNFLNGTVSVPTGNDGSTVNYSAPAGGGGGALVGSVEQSSTSPNGSQQTFAFTHTPTVIFWNGSFQLPIIDITISGNNVTFNGTNTPQTGDVVCNLYA